MSSILAQLARSINLADMVTHILLRGIKQLHNQLHREPNILSLKSHINLRDSVIVLINQKRLI